MVPDGVLAMEAWIERQVLKGKGNSLLVKFAREYLDQYRLEHRVNAMLLATIREFRRETNLAPTQD